MDYLTSFREFLISSKKAASKSTLKNYSADIAHFLGWFEQEFHHPFTPSELSTHTTDLFKQKLLADGHTLTTANRHLASLRKFAQFLKERGFIKTSPFEPPTSHLPPFGSAQGKPDPWHLKEFKDYLYVFGVKTNTIKNYLLDLRQFFDWVDKVKSDEYDRKNIVGNLPSLFEEYKKRLSSVVNLSDSSINRKLSSLRKYILWAASENYIPTLPPPLVEPKNLPRRQAGLPLPTQAQPPPLPTPSPLPPIRLVNRLFSLFELALERFIVEPVTSFLIRFGIVKPTYHYPTTASLNNIFKSQVSFTNVAKVNQKFYEKLRSSKMVRWGVVATIILTLIGLVITRIFIPRETRLPTKAGEQPPTAQITPGQQMPQVAVTPTRFLEFQGRLTNAQSLPITQPTKVRFAVYNDATSFDNTLLWEETNTVTPNQTGSFTIALGKSTLLPVRVFTDYEKIWLGITIGGGAELSPRQQLPNVDLARNAQLLQGKSPSTQGLVNTVPIIDSSGNLNLGAVSSSVTATNGSLTLEGQTVVIQTTAGSNGDIILSPDGTGRVDIQKGLFNSLGTVKIEDNLNLEVNSSTSAALTVRQLGTADLFQVWQGAETASPSSLLTLKSSGLLGIGTQSPNAFLDVTGATEQLRLSYNSTNYTSFTVSSGGDLTIDASGNDIIFADPVKIASMSSLFVKGAEKGRALVVFDETGDQNILAASASGTTKATLSRTGNLALAGELSNLTGDTLTIRDSFKIIPPTLTSGTGLVMDYTQGGTSDLFTGDLAKFSFTKTYNSGAASETGNLLDISRSLTRDIGGTGAFTISGALVSLSDTAATTGTGTGTITHSANVLFLDQNYSSATGSTLLIEHAGTGELALLDATGTGTTADGIRIRQTSTGTITDAIDVSDETITNALNVGSNTITGGGFTINSTSGDLALTTTTSGNITVTPAAATGLLNVLTGNLKVGDGTPTQTLDGEDAYIEGNLEVDGTFYSDGSISSAGDLTISNATPSLFLTDTTASEDDYSVNADGSAFTIKNETDGRNDLTISGGGAFTINGASVGEGTSVLTLTSGDLTLTDGDLTLSSGEIAATSDDATGTNFSLTAGALTTGTGLGVTSTSNSYTSGSILTTSLTQSAATGTAVSGDIAAISFSPTYSTAVTTPAISGNVLDISRSATTNTDFVSTLTVSGPILNITNTATQTTGTLTDSSNLVVVTQDADATGALLHLVSNRSSTNYSLLIEQTSGGTDTLSLTDAGNLAINGDFTVTGGDLNGPSGENIDLGEATADTITFYIATGGELSLNATALFPTTDSGLDLGSSTSQFADLYLDGGNINLDNLTDVDIDNDLASSFTISEGASNFLNIKTTAIDAMEFGNATTNPTFGFLGTGAVTIAGSADGTDALVLTLGDILITNGDLDLSGGDFNVVLDAGDGVNISKGAAPTVDVFTINGGTSATDGVDNLQLTFTASNASGNVIDITPSVSVNASDTFNVVDIDAFTATISAAGTLTLNGFSVGTLTQSETTGTITATGFNIGTGWDTDINATTSLEIGIGGTNQLTLTDGALAGTTDNDIDLGTSSSQFKDFYIQGDIIADTATDIDIDDNTASAFTITAGTDTYFLITTSTGAEVVTLNNVEAGTMNIGTTNVTRTLNLATGTGADTINIGTGATNADAITLGNTSVATTFDINSGAATVNAIDIATDSVSSANALAVTANALTTGTALAVSSTATSFNGELLTLSKTATTGSTAFTSDLANITYSQTFDGGVGLDSTGNVLDVSRAITISNATQTHTISGALMTIADSGTETAGDINNTSNVLRLAQNCGTGVTCSGAVLKIANSGTGADIALDNDETITNSTDGTIAFGADKLTLGTAAVSGNLFTANYAASATQTGALLGLVVDTSNNVTVPNTSSGNQTGINLTLKDGGTSATAIGIDIDGTYDRGIDFSAGTVSTGGSIIYNDTSSTIDLAAAADNVLEITNSSGTTVNDNIITLEIDANTDASDKILFRVVSDVGGTEQTKFTIDSDGDISATNITVVTDLTCTDCLDFTDFEDTLDLDNNLTLNQTTYTWSQTFTGATTVGLTYTANSLTTGTAMRLTSSGTITTGGELLDLVGNGITTGNLITASSTALTSGSLLSFTGPSGGTVGATGSIASLTSDLGNDGRMLTSTATFDSTAASASSYNLYLSTTNNNSTNANSAYGLYSTLTDAVALANTDYGLYATVTNTGANTLGTKNVYGLYSTASNTTTGVGGTAITYGGYFSSTGDTGGTSTSYGIYATASGADTNYPAYFVTSQPAAASGAAGTDADALIGLSAAAGGNTTIATTGTGGIGSGLAWTLGTGGTAASANTASTGGAGGAYSTTGGTGGAAAATGTNLGGAGGAISLTGGTGGNASGGTSNTGGAGGGITLTTGNAGSGGSANAGTLSLQVGTITGSGTAAINIGTTTTAKTINLAGTGATGADTINIGTGGTGADTITIGSTAASTALALNDDNWNITGAGVANFVSVGATTAGTGAFTTLTSSGASTIGTGSSLTNTFGSGASSINTIGSTTTPGTLTLHGATTLDNTFTVSGSNLTSLGGNLTVTGTAWTATPTISGLITATSGLTSNGAVTVQNNSNLAISSGTGVFTQTHAPTTDATADAHTITLSAGGTGSTGTLRGLVVNQADTATTGVYDTLAYLGNQKTPETTTNGLFIEQNAASGTLSNAIQITNTAGTLSTGINFTGTFTNYIVAPNFSVSNAGAVVAVGVNSGSGLIQGTGGLTVTGTTNINATGTAATNIGNSTGALVLASGGTSSWTNTSGNLTIQTATSGTLAIDSAGALNLGTTNATSTSLGKAATTLTVNPTAWTATPTISGLITATSGLTSNGAVTVQNNSNLTLSSGTGTFTQTYSGTTGTAQTLTLSGAATTTIGQSIGQTVTYGATTTNSGNLSSLTRALTINDADPVTLVSTLTVNSPVVSLSDNCTVAGNDVCTHSGGLLSLTQSYASSTGTVLALSNAGTGMTISVTDDDLIGLGTAAGRIEFDDQATDEVNILNANVGIGTATPAQKLDVEGSIRIQGGQSLLWNNEAAWSILGRTATSTTMLGTNIKHIVYTGNGIAPASEGFAVVMSGGTSNFEVDNDGQAYIKAKLGIADASPDAILDLDSTGTTGGDFLITNTGIGTSGSVATITANSYTTGDILTLNGTALTTGSLLTLTGPSGGTAGVTDAQLKIASDVGNIGTSNGLISSTATFDGTTASGVNLYLSSTDAVASGNTDYGIYNTVSNTGAITTQTKNVYGSYTSASGTGGTTTTPTTNVYGSYITTTASHATDVGTVNQYGLYIANGTSSTTGTSTKTGLYVESPTGADTNYAAVFAGGNVGIGTASPATALSVVGTITATGNLNLNSSAPQIQQAGSQILAADANTLYIGRSATLTSGIQFQPGIATAMTITNAGSVGIGDASPDVLLDILSATTGSDIIITNTNGTDTDVTVGFALVDGTNNFTIGVDDSVAGDPFKISTTALGTGDTLTLDSRTTTSGVSALTFATGTAPTIASAITAYFNSSTFTPGTVNFSGSTQITSTGTSANNAILFNQPTINRTDAASSLTIDQASNIFINGPTIASHATVGQTETITASAALRIGAGSSVAGTRGVVTNAYGLYVDAPTGAGTNYAATFAGGNVGIGTASPNNRLEVLSTTTPQLRVAYDTSAYMTTAVAATTGAVTFDTNGTVPSFTFSDAVTLSAGGTLGGTLNANSQDITNVSHIVFNNADKALQRNVRNDYLHLDGGDAGGSFGGVVRLYGSTHATLPGVVDLATPRSDQAALMSRLSISGVVDTAVATWSDVTHTGIVLSGALNANSQSITSAATITMIADAQIKSTLTNSAVILSGGNVTGGGGATVNLYGKGHAQAGKIFIQTPNAAGNDDVTRFTIYGNADAANGIIALQPGGGNVGIGDVSPASLLTVGASDAFQVNSTGAIAAATGITSSGTITFSGLTNCNTIDTGAGGVLACGKDAGAEYTAYTANGTWTKANYTGPTLVIVEAFGAGGGGGGGRGWSNFNTRGGGGSGGGGARSRAILDAASLGAIETVTVGAGGGGGGGGTNADGTSGTVGANSSFGSWLIAYGGGPGTAGDSSGAAKQGGGGGGTAGAGGGPGAVTGGIPTDAGSSSTVKDVTGGSGAYGGFSGTGSGGSAEYGGGGGGGAPFDTGGGGGGGSSKFGGGGGGGGGIVNSSDTQSAGGAGGSGNSYTAGAQGGGGAIGGGAGSNGSAGSNGFGGNGGAGGGGNVGGTGGAGGIGGAPAGGGGGGGAGTSTGGAGGTGGRGEIRVWTVTGGTGADLAEVYYSLDMSLEAADVVVADPDLPGVGFKKSDKAYDGKVLGIMSTKPGLVLGDEEAPDLQGKVAKPVMLALAGRVPVKVSTENGPILVGDYLTSSSVPGVAMKATKAGPTVGKALEPFGSGDELLVHGAGTDSTTNNEPSTHNQVGKILAFVNVSYWDPDVMLTSTGDLIIAREASPSADPLFTEMNQELGIRNQATESASLTHNSLFLIHNSLGRMIDRVGAFAQLAVAHVKAGLIETKELMVEGSANVAGNLRAGFIETQELVSPIAKIDQLQTDFISPISGDLVVRLGNQEAGIGNQASDSASLIHDSKFIIQDASGAAVFSLDQQGDATLSGTLRAGKIVADEIQGATVSAQYITNVTNVTQIVTNESTNQPINQSTNERATPSAQPSPEATAGEADLANQAEIDSAITAIPDSLFIIPDSDYVNIDPFQTEFASINNLEAETATFTQGLMSFGMSSFADLSISQSLTLGSDFIFTEGSINVLGSDLMFQNLRQGGVSIADGRVYVDRDGNVKVEGNLAVGGTLTANIISPVPEGDLVIHLGGGRTDSPDGGLGGNLIVQNASGSAVLQVNQQGDVAASGSATFAKLNLNPASPVLAISDTEMVASSSAGVAKILAGQSELTVKTPFVTENSLIFLTPVYGELQTHNPPQIYLMRQLPNGPALPSSRAQAEGSGVEGSFTAGIKTPALEDLLFNWLIVN